MAENGTTLPTNPSTEETSFAENKGKGKAAAEDVPHTGDAAMDEDDDEDDDDDDDDDDDEEENAAGGEEEDGMEEIDLNNIVDGGRRTRGAKIDFAKAAEQLPADEDEEDDDEDFQPPAEDTEMTG
ncbi:histone chaperone domain CHZ domain-containing protein [Pochonia chlamydosporia 170]|uniref:Histone chaperone domain CHZ domain-containing protein n=1 Tax=Pochonia chlamydosporia 170 TaxID=1380566 RepID=A0A179F697_METCM|nr:histone chaperone domain CHZ domain-containing protein [Pochonia chlamydosporia 170]OAQ60965.1 histone chaperone domain CHZ domain-containing protein [Pochonia chlamydosporia 170]